MSIWSSRPETILLPQADEYGLTPHGRSADMPTIEVGFAFSAMSELVRVSLSTDWCEHPFWYPQHVDLDLYLTADKLDELAATFARMAEMHRENLRRWTQDGMA